MTHRVEHARAEDFLPTVPDASVGLILTDPPYFRVKGEAWDRAWSDADRFVAWLSGVADEWARVLKPNGTLVCFAGAGGAQSKGATLAARVETMLGERFNVAASAVWVKADAAGYGKHSVQNRAGLRTYFPQTERAVICEHKRQSWSAQIASALAARGMSHADLAVRLGCDSRLVYGWTVGDRAPHGRFAVALESWLGEPLCADRPFDATAGAHFTDVWAYPTVQARKGKHPCQKPPAMAADIVSQCSRPGDVVLDTFAGSGVFLAAAAAAGRTAWGCDADEWWACSARRAVVAATPRAREVLRPEPAEAATAGQLSFLAEVS